ncbi:hypothetical protein L9F63_006992, partial [Diploptera punctata]
RMDVLQVSVRVKNNIWDHFIILNDGVVFCDIDEEETAPAHLQHIKSSTSKQLCKNNVSIQCVKNRQKNNGQEILEKVNKLDISSHGDGCSNTTIIYRQHKNIPKLYTSGYFLSLFIKTLQRSAVYRRHVLARFQGLLKNTGPLQLNIKIVEPHKEIIDYAWGKRMERLELERRELDLAMSWLSTLGGAFSALGEEFQHCAEIAGRISVHQFSIALRLGDPLTVARCKLYFALSLIQRGHLVQARCIICQQYHLAKENPVLDTRLIAMCHGIWARLKYEHQKRRARFCRI